MGGAEGCVGLSTLRGVGLGPRPAAQAVCVGPSALEATARSKAKARTSHLSDDETVAKMGHPCVSGFLEESNDNDNSNSNVTALE